MFKTAYSYYSTFKYCTKFKVGEIHLTLHAVEIISLIKTIIKHMHNKWTLRETNATLIVTTFFLPFNVNRYYLAGRFFSFNL